MSAPEERSEAGGGGGASTAGRAGQNGFNALAGTSAKAGAPSVAGAGAGGVPGSSGAPATGGQISDAGGGAGGASAGSAGTAAGGTTAACASRSFEYVGSGQSPTSVHLSGTFNDWAEPGLPLAYDAASQSWKVSLELAAGSYAYKFVLDAKTWVADPSNPEQESDTFGGVNSLITVVCP